MISTRLMIPVALLFMANVEAQESTKTADVVLQDSFETGSKVPDGWTSGANIPGVEYVYDKRNGATGKRSLSLNKSVRRYFPIAQWYRIIPAPESPTVNVSAKVRARNMTKAILEVQFLDDSKKMIGKKWVGYIGAKKPSDKPASHNWKEYGDSAKIPENTKHLLIGLQIYGPGQVWFDDLKVTTGDAAVSQKESSDATTIEINNADAQYIYGAPRTPNEDGNGLLVVLPGGNGSADFQPFVSSLHEQTVGADYALAQPIATKWSNDQKIVWPTSHSSVAGMKYSTEELIEAVIADVSRKTPLDPKRILLLAWSSSGQAAYATMLQKETQVSGALVAMSVFKPNSLPALTNAKDRRFYVLHSPQDRVCPHWMAKQAKQQLAQKGAKVELVEYEGGHGWRGEVMDNVTAGLRWLQEEVTECSDLCF